MDPFSRLSLDQLSLVLSHVNIKHRLSACSLVSSTWRAAAAQATIALKIAEASFFPPSLWQWLRLHTAAVQFSYLSIANKAGSAPELALPLFQLHSLKILTLDKVPWRPVTEAATSATAAAAQPQAELLAPLSSSFRQQGLQPLTALTQLQLAGSSVRLAGLSTLTALQVLACDGIDPESSAGERQLHIPALKTVGAELVAAFPQLQRLTQLNLFRAAASPAVVSKISSLQSLQKLELRRTPANSFPVLPQSLTHLPLVPNQPCSLTPSNAAGLSRLTALDFLRLSAKPLDMSLLTGMRSLRVLRLVSTEVAPGQLQVISCLTNLTLLVLDLTQRGQEPSPVTISAAEAGALTSSNQLAVLALSEPGKHLVQDYASLFPPGRQLQHLTALVVSEDFVNNAAAVKQAGSCCPNLCYAKFSKHVQLTDERLVAEGLTAMSGWMKLCILQLEDPLPVTPGWLCWQALGSFQRLHDLRIRVNSPRAEEPEDLQVLYLEGCRMLRHLLIDLRADDGPFVVHGFRSWKLELHSTAARGERPNVSRRLRQQLKRTAAHRYTRTDVYCNAYDFEESSDYEGSW